MGIDEFEVLVSGKTPVLADFFSTTCDPCKWLLPILDDVENYFNDKLMIIKINVEQSTELAHKFDIRSVPTLILFKDNREIWRIAGFDTSPVMINKIKEHLKV